MSIRDHQTRDLPRSRVGLQGRTVRTPDAGDRTVSPWTLVRFLAGRRTTIVELATSRGVLPLGGLLVLSAALAREYDQSNLLAEPWHLLIPFAASIVSSFVLYVIVGAAAWRHGVRDRGPFALYPAFLSVYWMTAPLAWLYAIPVERFLDPAAAVRANLTLLGLVALWRVVLTIQVVRVMFGAGFWSALALVMFFADTLAVVAILSMPKPIIAVMGGIHYTADERILLDLTHQIGAICAVTWPVWAIGALVVLSRKNPLWGGLQVQHMPPRRIARSLGMVGAIAILLGVAILPTTQSEQKLATRVERDLYAGELAAGIRTMSSHSPGDFPPHWNPPPRWAYGEYEPDLIEMLEVVVAEKPAAWVRRKYVDKLAGQMSEHGDWSWLLFSPNADRILAILERVEEGPSVIQGAEDPTSLLESEFLDIDQSTRDRINALVTRANALPPVEWPSE